MNLQKYLFAYRYSVSGGKGLKYHFIAIIWQWYKIKNLPSAVFCVCSAKEH
jgi:hypothetical protein